MALSGLASAQHSSGYAFVAPVVLPESFFTRWQGTFLHVGGGGETALGGRFGAGGEVGVLIPLTNDNGVTAGLLSGNLSYHFQDSRESKIDPFLTGGISLLFSGGAAGLLNYGGGVNLWLHPRVGVRLEFRDHLWSPEGESLHFLGIRIGMAFR